MKPPPRIIELCQRLTSSGPIHEKLSASEHHEICDFIFELDEAELGSFEIAEQEVRLAANRCLEFVAVGKNNHSVPVEVSFQQIIRECVKRAVANE